VKIDRVKIDGSRLSCPAQSNVPHTATCGTETNIRISAGQGESETPAVEQSSSTQISMSRGWRRVESTLSL